MKWRFIYSIKKLNTRMDHVVTSLCFIQNEIVPSNNLRNLLTIIRVNSPQIRLDKKDKQPTVGQENAPP